MAQTKTLNEKQFTSFLDSLIKDYEFIAPTKDSYGKINLEKIKKSGDIFFDYVVTDNSPTNIILPKREVLFSFQKEKGNVIIKDVELKKDKRIIFGARPCDAKALKNLDKVFNWDDVKDKNFNQSRENTILVGVGCNKTNGTCFCTSVGVTPHQKDNLDVMVYVLDDRKNKGYMIECVTKKGEEAFKAAKGKAAAKKDIDEQKSLEKKAASSIKHKFDHNKLKEKLDRVFHHEEFWKEQTNKCIRCGICASLCPSCYCFDMADEKNERCRFWDACTLKAFTKQSSGFNPRFDKFKGYRQRFYHKFNYFNKRFKDPLCTGCGRCSIHCPTSIDILEVALNVPENMPKETDEKPDHEFKEHDTCKK